MPITVDNSTTNTPLGTYGEGALYAYAAQTFTAPGYGMHEVSVFIRNKDDADTKFNLLITTVIEDETGLRPGRVLKEVKGLVEPVDGVESMEEITVDLGGVRLEKGETYAFVIDMFGASDGFDDSALLGGIAPGTYDGGLFMNLAPPYAGRDADFEADWEEFEFVDLAFKATFSDEGKTINGTKKNDKLNGTSDDDWIDGKKGNDKLNGKDGFDTLIGGKNKDVLKGGDDGDVLIGGKDKDKLYGQEGYDCYVFDFKMTKKSAKKHQDKIYSFETDKDEIHLKQKYFSGLELGERPEDDTMITYKNKALFYDDIKFVKFKQGAPSSLDDIDIVVVA